MYFSEKQDLTNQKLNLSLDWKLFGNQNIPINES